MTTLKTLLRRSTLLQYESKSIPQVRVKALDDLQNEIGRPVIDVGEAFTLETGVLTDSDELPPRILAEVSWIASRLPNGLERVLAQHHLHPVAERGRVGCLDDQ